MLGIRKQLQLTVRLGAFGMGWDPTKVFGSPRAIAAFI